MRRVQASRAAVLAVVLTASLVPTAVGAESAPALRAQAQQLAARADGLESRADSALHELYAVETKLGRARADVERLRTQARALERERASARRLAAVTERVLAVSQRRLGDVVRELYEQGETDPLAILLGAESLDAAITGLDNLSRSVQENRDVLRQATTAKKRLAGLRARLATRGAELRRLLRQAEAAAAELERARAERAGTVARLRAEQRLSRAQVARLERTAAAAQRRTAALEAAAPSQATAPVATPAEAIVTAAEPEHGAGGDAAATAAAGGGRTLVVETTGYALQGTTASGLPVGWGIVAVDPAVIPLGTRLTIPGYGEAVAADTGGAVRGAMVDLWFPTTAQALAWGRRTVTIVVH